MNAEQTAKKLSPAQRRMVLAEGEFAADHHGGGTDARIKASAWWRTLESLRRKGIVPRMFPERISGTGKARCLDTEKRVTLTAFGQEVAACLRNK
jgi:hypothetical protein